MYNECIKQNKFPAEWKVAVVTPLFKNKGAHTDVNNYRGISVLPPLCKIFERILASQIKAYFESYKIFFTGQHGFRQNHSCESALHEIISTCFKNLDNKLINMLLFIDFKKAFDMVDSKLLIYKLQNYGFSKNAVSLIENYFFNRHQFTKIGNIKSTVNDLLLGVPQGSVLGPLFFIIFINDLPYFLDEIITKLFADDTTLIFADNDLSSIVSKFKNGLKSLNEWCKHNRLYINWSKTFVMFITNKKICLPTFIEMESIKIEVVSRFKLLGVVIDNKLQFKDFVSNQCLSINKRLFSIKRLFYLPFDVKLQFFKTFILPYFDYGLSLSIYYQKSVVQKLCKSYYLCLMRLFNFRFPNLSHHQINIFLKAHNLFSFQHRLTYRLCLFLHKCLHSINSPEQLKSWLRPSNKCSNYNLRSNNRHDFEIDKAQTRFGDLTFKNICNRFFNKTKFIDFNSDFTKFKKELNLNKVMDLFTSLTDLFPKFNTELSFYFFYIK